ncbi:IclR family transcriptional regulator [Halosolutus amylolyticus]|uniref:IclR family transcriptional regulator n=1 Tax=Halosolutus amylolyticus TaxID=2932267 RepID=A0ABD5PJQ9_9EURY|nr:IclR family transcriptional regulator [Halosolutus amylolyticus]
MSENGAHESVKTTERSLDVVRVVQERGGVRISDIVEEFDMAKSTAYKHLRTLESRGYLVKEGEQYHIGLKFMNRGEYARTRKPAYRIAEDIVDDLADRTEHEVDFLVENDGRSIAVHFSYDPTNPFQDMNADPTNKHWRKGTYYHLHCIAAGKAILAHLPREAVEAIIEQWGLPARTERTITDPDELFAELETIREQGYAYSEGEYTDGMAAIAMPVIEPTGELLGGLAVNGPTYSLQNPDRRAELQSTLEEVVTAFETRLENIEWPDPFEQGTMS